MLNDSIPPLHLLDAKSYIQDLVKTIDGAKNRVNLISLVLTEDTRTENLIESLTMAAKRGVSVTIAVDSFTFAELGGYFSPFQRSSSESKIALAMADRLRAAGATFVWLGRSVKLNPFSGVTHLKWTVVDDTTYCFGGVNLYKHGIESTDYMFKSIDPILADEISTQHHILTRDSTSPSSYPGYKSTRAYGTVYIDSGKKGDSIIYNRLTELTLQAKHVLVTTQYCPSGKLATYLKHKSDVYYNPSSHMQYPAKLLIQYGEIRTGLRSQYTRLNYLHAKFMIFTMHDGKKIAISGSHNFSYSGVLFGTKEVALETSDSNVIKQLELFHKTHVQ
jgi:cardiolipin synthase